jgi:hypothetical protein
MSSTPIGFASGFAEEFSDIPPAQSSNAALNDAVGTLVA